MSQSYDRPHADALHRHSRDKMFERFWRQAGMVLALVVIGAAATPFVMLDEVRRWEARVYGQARAAVWFFTGFKDDPTITVWYHGQPYRLSARDVTASPDYSDAFQTMLALAGAGGALGVWAGLSGLYLLRGAWARRRERALQDRVIAGTWVTTEHQLSKMTRASAPPRALVIGSVPFSTNLETRHLAICGTTGSGKTTALRQLLDGIEARGEPALVYDTSGDFVANYYRPERGDFVLNPFDARAPFWSPFAEIAHPADADRIARQLVTETGQQDRDVWLETSRILVANMIRTLWREGNGSLSALLDALQVRTKDDLKIWLADTSSARTFAEDADRATGSVLFMLAKAANLIQFLRAEQTGGAPFAFRDFIKGLDKCPGPKPWVFVPRKEDFFEASKPLLACWLDCAATAMLGLAPSPNRRIWFVLDELADLPSVDNLARLLPQGRKFGAAVVLTFQAVGQMRHRYGGQIAEAMLGCCNTKLFLQAVDSETRQWASRTIGECEVEIQTVTDTLAEGDGKSRTTLGKMRKTQPAVMESQLRLPRFEGFLLLPDGMPVARIRLSADHIARRGRAKHPGFVAGNPANSLWERAAKAEPAHTRSPSSPPASEGPV